MTELTPTIHKKIMNWPKFISILLTVYLLLLVISCLIYWLTLSIIWLKYGESNFLILCDKSEVFLSMTKYSLFLSNEWKGLEDISFKLNQYLGPGHAFSAYISILLVGSSINSFIE